MGEHLGLVVQTSSSTGLLGYVGMFTMFLTFMSSDVNSIINPFGTVREASHIRARPGQNP